MPEVKYLGKKKIDTSNLPKMYPIANCKKNQFPLYAMPGILIKVRTEVSVATMDNMATTQGRFLLPKKKSDIVLFLMLWIQPYAIIAAKNKTINKTIDKIDKF